MFTVLTHNGKLPSEGGIRLGYKVGNRLFPLGGPAGGILLKLETPLASKQAEIHRAVPFIPEARLGWDGSTAHCPSCRGKNHSVSIGVVVFCEWCSYRFKVV
jgi:hypothetical protein